MKKIIIYSGISMGAIFLIVVALYFVYNLPLERALFLTPVCHLPTEEKVVALTFDDGPSVSRTPALIELLQKHNVKATFFMTGVQMKKHWEVAQQVAANGHLIGNHSYDHVRLIFKSPSEIEHQIDATDSLIVRTGNNNLKYFRPPYGDKLVILPWLLVKKDKLLVNFDVGCPSQYDTPMNVNGVVREAVSGSSSGSIIVLHDGWEREADLFITAVDEIIISLKAKGFRFVRLDEKI